MGVEPTKETAATPGSSSSASTTSLPPWTTLKTPSGSPASCHSSATSVEGDGSRSLGLRMNVLPHAIATGYIHIGTITGKLNGVIPATTPSGDRNEKTSTSVDAWSEKDPLSRWGMPHANSTTSRPRSTSPRASERTFPCSELTSSASSPARAVASSRNAKRTFARRESDDWDHSSKAAAATRTASATSAAEPRTTSACWAPVAGSQTGAVPAGFPEVGLPPIQCSIVRISSLLAAAQRADDQTVDAHVQGLVVTDGTEGAEHVADVGVHPRAARPQQGDPLVDVLAQLLGRIRRRR